MMYDERERMSVFKRVLDGVNNREPSKDEKVEHAKMKAQTKETVDRARAEAKKNREAMESMDRRDK